MKTFIIFLILVLSLNSCGKGPNETVDSTSSAEYSDNYQDSISAPDTAGQVMTDAAPDIQEGNDKQPINQPSGDKTITAAPSLTYSAHDSVRVSFNKVSTAIKNRQFEVLNPVVKRAPSSAEYTAPPPPMPDPVPTMPSAEPTNTDAGTVAPEPEPAAVEEKPKNAVLGFSYFPEIPQYETRDLRVFVKVQGDEIQVAKKLREIEKEDMEFTKTDDSSVVCLIKNIQAYKKLSIKPIFDEEDFRVTRVDEDVQGLVDIDPNEQTLDFKNGNYWHWKVKAIAKSAHMGNITLRIKAETPEGQKIQLAERQINIKIGINVPKLSFGEKVYAFADSHFKEILSLIIIPLALYLVNILRKRFFAKKEIDDPLKKP